MAKASDKIASDHPGIAPLVGPDDPRRFTDSGIEIQPVYDEEDVEAQLHGLGWLAAHRWWFAAGFGVLLAAATAFEKRAKEVAPVVTQVAAPTIDEADDGLTVKAPMPAKLVQL